MGYACDAQGIISGCTNDSRTVCSMTMFICDDITVATKIISINIINITVSVIIHVIIWYLRLVYPHHFLQIRMSSITCLRSVYSRMQARVTEGRPSSRMVTSVFTPKAPPSPINRPAKSDPPITRL